MWHDVSRVCVRETLECIFRATGRLHASPGLCWSQLWALDETGERGFWAVPHRAQVGISIFSPSGSFRHLNCSYCFVQTETLVKGGPSEGRVPGQELSWLWFCVCGHECADKTLHAAFRSKDA